MPDPAYTHLYDAAVLLPFSGYDRNGKHMVDETKAVEIRVRWDDTRSQQLDPQGNTITVDATVIASRNITIGSRMWRGTLADFAGTGSGAQPSGVMEVKTEKVVYDLKHRAVGRTYGLLRYHDA